MSILIVEDNPVNARLLSLMLQEQGYQTVTAENGKEALKKVPEIPDTQLIITDYLMPEMDGLEFIVKVRALPTFNHAPILVASAHGDFETVKRVHDLRCDGFLLKPIDKGQLIKRVGQLMRSQSHELFGKNNAMEKWGLGRLNITIWSKHLMPNWPRPSRWWCWNKENRASPFPRVWASC